MKYCQSKDYPCSNTTKLTQNYQMDDIIKSEVLWEELKYKLKKKFCSRANLRKKVKQMTYSFDFGRVDTKSSEQDEESIGNYNGEEICQQDLFLKLYQV